MCGFSILLLLPLNIFKASCIYLEGNNYTERQRKRERDVSSTDAPLMATMAGTGPGRGKELDWEWISSDVYLCSNAMPECRQCLTYGSFRVLIPIPQLLFHNTISGDLIPLRRWRSSWAQFSVKLTVSLVFAATAGFCAGVAQCLAFVLRFSESGVVLKSVWANLPCPEWSSPSL